MRGRFDLRRATTFLLVGARCREHAAVQVTNRVIENYCDAKQMLSRWADRSRLGDHVAFLDGAGADTFDWWGAPEHERTNELNEAIADRESRERQGASVRWPWSKVQRSDSSKG